MEHSKKEANSLINESSPYLLQHAYNPVKWLPWSKEAFKKADKENKLVLISVGYSACHWCHVMEKESFEDVEVAQLMNESFICIKVDREERPDVDNLYMTAVQIMTGQGGWPLNCFALPDGRPIYGGTYFPKKQWMHLLVNLSELLKKDKEKVEEYAKSLTEGIKQTELINIAGAEKKLDFNSAIHKCIDNWKPRFDNTNGGANKVPKFPLPNNYLFLLRYAYLYGDNDVLNHVTITLQKMAHGGIYDQLHGGFARYSTDGIWKVPHFEKMLYDNAQLVSLYAEAFRLTKNVLYKQVVDETIDFVMKEWFHESGYFYSALDADSEGEEGKYYTWEEEELKQILKNDYDLFADFYQINEIGYWENEQYILMRNENVSQILLNHNLSVAELHEKINSLKFTLQKKAEKRVKPGLDNKVITSWNALMVKGLVDAYLATGNENYKLTAIKSAEFILNNLIGANNELYRIYHNGNKKIKAFLDDYAFTIDAFIAVYAVSGIEKFIFKAKQLNEFVMDNFKNENSSLFYFTGTNNVDLVARQTETSDNVIPSSNSQMALNLHALGLYFGLPEYINRAGEMLNLFTDEMHRYGSGYSNWGILALQFSKPFYEIAIVGKAVNEKMLELHKHYFTNAILAVSETPSETPLLKNRYKDGETLIYVCKNNSCLQPLTNVGEVIKQIEKE